MARKERPLLSPEEFQRLKHAPKAEVLAVLERYVRLEAGRPKGDTEPFSSTERVRLYRERQRAEERKQKKPVLPPPK